MKPILVLAFDLGASGGRAIVGKIDLDARKVEMEEIYRFPNSPIRVRDHLYWDVLRIWNEVKEGISIAYKKYGEQIISIGIDTWGVDFALLDSNGELVGLPYSYRDPRRSQAMRELLSVIPPEKIYMKTGIQFTPINPLYQLYAMVKDGSSLQQAARTLFMMPDLFNYWLSGIIVSEYTDASTTQFLDPWTKKWALDLLEEIGFPTNIFPEVIEPGTKLGKIDPRLAEELRVSKDIEIIAPATHDTASAVAASPIDKDSAYISCGTWSLVGVELDQPLVNKKTMEYNFTNEGGAFNTIRFLKNIQGMWFIQEIKRMLAKRGQEYDYAELTKLASEVRGFIGFIDPDDPRFLAPLDMIDEIMKFLEETGQEKPKTVGELVRLVLESLALKYRLVIEKIEDLTGMKIKRINIVGGGSRNWVHNQLVADFTDKLVEAGPEEATSIGNILIQLAGLGYVKSLREIREYVRNSFEVKQYKPNHTSKHEDAYSKFISILEKTVGLAGWALKFD
ncbi:MAG: rhamnulokinase family protein [Desulfurococcus sp.]|uniref:rhamnulokinase n=1 Tax=Desulfurococcus sp. TaxID=51678 RepID=UPI003164F7A3